MVNFVSSSYNSYQALQSNKMPKKVRKLINDLEKQLPNLPPEKQNEMIHRIAAIKAAAKSSAVKNALSNTAMEGAKTLGSQMGGPIGSAVATYATHDAQEKIANEEKFVITKAEKIGGRRVQRNMKKPQTEKTSALWNAALTGVLGAGMGIGFSVALSTAAAKGLKDYGQSFLDYGKSYFQ